MGVSFRSLGTTPGTGTTPSCPEGSTWNPNEGRCVSVFDPTGPAYTPKEPVPAADDGIPEPVDPYGPAPGPLPATKKTPWAIIAVAGAAALGVWWLARR
jgi:hypothetical protein